MASGPVTGARELRGTGPGIKGELSGSSCCDAKCQSAVSREQSIQDNDFDSVLTCMATLLILLGESTSCAKGGAYTWRLLRYSPPLPSSNMALVATPWGEAVCSTGAHTCRGSDNLANFLMGPPPRDGSVRGSCCMSAPDPVIIVL